MPHGSQKAPTPMDIHVGRRVLLRRKAVGLSQAGLARQIGVTFQQVQKYEKGANRVGAVRLQAIAEALGVPVMHFFEGWSTQDGDVPGGDGPALLAGFVGLPESRALMASMLAIRHAGLRRRIVAMIEAVAEQAGAPDRAGPPSR